MCDVLSHVKETYKNLEKFKGLVILEKHHENAGFGCPQNLHASKTCMQLSDIMEYCCYYYLRYIATVHYGVLLLLLSRVYSYCTGIYVASKYQQQSLKFLLTLYVAS